ncbi:MAG: hypothetical protein ACT4P3_12225 [Betaproteobacteria bacterium]
MRLAALALALAAWTVPASAQTKLLLSTFFPQGHALYARVLLPWARDLEKSTNGALVIEFAPSSLAPPPGQLDMVAKGIADLSAQYSGLLPNRLHLPLVSEVPGLATTSEAMSIALWRTDEKFFRPADEYKPTKMIGLLVFPPQDFYGVTDTPILSIEQLKSAKIAATPGMIARAYGAVTTGIVAGPAFRYFELVSKGSVDAYAAATPLDVVSFNLARYTKYVVRMKQTVGTAGSFALVLNDKKWNGLDPKLKAALERAGGENFARRMAELDRVAAENDSRLREQGVKYLDGPPAYAEALRKAFAFMTDDWIAEANKRGVNGKAAIDFYRAEQTRLAGAK